MRTIIVPVDGATHIKLEVLNLETLVTVASEMTGTPTTQVDGFAYNCTAEEFAWFDQQIKALPAELRSAAVVAPVARGASGGLVGCDNRLIEGPDGGLTLSYDHHYPERVEQQFRHLAGSEAEFYAQTGSMLSYPGSLTLAKRMLFEQMERLPLLKRSGGFGGYGTLMAGHFLSDDFVRAVKLAGNEHSYWMCHAGARDITKKPGTPSKLVIKLGQMGGEEGMFEHGLFWNFVPKEAAVCYRSIGEMPRPQAEYLTLITMPLIVPGAHDTCVSHIPLVSTFYQAFPEMKGKPIVHVDGGTWTMTAQLGVRTAVLPENGYEHGIMCQGSVDGEPVVTGMYRGGTDFNYLQSRIRERYGGARPEFNESALEQSLIGLNCFVLPNLTKESQGSGPFPNVNGKILNEEEFFSDPGKAFVYANLMTASVTAYHVDEIASEGAPIVLSAGASKDPYFGRLLATMTGRKVYAMYDKDGNPINETTTLGMGIVGKAALLNCHPYDVDVSSLGVQYKELQPFTGRIGEKISQYRSILMEKIVEAN